MDPERVQCIANGGRYGRQRSFTQTMYLRSLSLKQVRSEGLGQISCRRNIVIREIGVCRLPLLKGDLLEKRCAQPHNHRAFILQFRSWAIHDMPCINRSMELEDLKLSCFFINAHLGCGGALMPVGRGNALAGIGIKTACIDTLAIAKFDPGMYEEVKVFAGPSKPAR